MASARPKKTAFWRKIVAEMLYFMLLCAHAGVVWEPSVSSGCLSPAAPGGQGWGQGEEGGGFTLRLAVPWGVLGKEMWLPRQLEHHDI